MTAMNETPGEQKLDGADDVDNAADPSLDAADPKAAADASSQPATTAPLPQRSANIGHT